MMTLNTHSLIEENYDKKLNEFIGYVMIERPYIIALQEVNQSIDSYSVKNSELIGYYPCEEVKLPIREDNHAFNVANKLLKNGLKYNWTWLPCKVGYDKYDEGLALLTLDHIVETKNFLISDTSEYKNWKTRRALGIRTENSDEWYFSMHMGWWKDDEEPFNVQWQKFSNQLLSIKGENIWLMGDFNSDADVKGEGYELIKNSGWCDTYLNADKKNDGYTVEKPIDGWRNTGEDFKKMRLDYIWSKKDINVKSSYVIFDGKSTEKVSDHYGIVVATE